MKCYIIFVLFAFVLQNAFAAMSEAQLKATAKMIRNVCQPKSKATDEAIDGMQKGNWEVDQTTKCYLYCILNMNKLITKENTFNYEAGLMQLKTLPEARVPSTKKCMETCKDAVKTTDDKCVAAYELMKCWYFCSPEEYFFP